MEDCDSIVAMLTQECLSKKSSTEIANLILDLQRKLAEKEICIQKKNAEIELLRHQLNVTLQNKYGCKSDKVDPSRQFQLFNEAETQNLESNEIVKAEESISIASHTRQKSGRKPLPSELPRVRQEYDLLESEKTCSCGCALIRIGEDVSEQLEFIPAKVQVIQHVKFKYACKACEETIRSAKSPLLPIPKSIASPGLLAHILVSKFKDHLPLYRQELILQRMKVDIPRNTLAHWIISCSIILKPLMDWMQKIQISYDIGYSDETTVQVLKEEGRKPENKSYMWLFIGGSPEERSIVYQYHSTRAQTVPKEYWKDFNGYLHCDGYAAYLALFSSAPIQGVHCWAHARRKFVDIIKANKTKNEGLCHWAVAQIAKLYKIEHEVKELSLLPHEIKKLRQEKSKPLLDEMKQWLDKNIHRTLPQAPIGQAIAYCLKYWGNLERYIEDGRLDIDNNLSERAIKHFATGRKNWIFADTPRGAEASAIIFSLIETCKYHQVEPYLYLKTVLEKIPYCKTEEEYRQLLPFHIKSKLL